MRGRAGLSGFLQTDYRMALRDPSSGPSGMVFSRKREKDTKPAKARVSPKLAAVLLLAPT